MKEKIVSRLSAIAVALVTLVVASVAARAAEVQPLVSAVWLSEHLKDSDLVVLDIRSDRNGGGQKAYAAAHIPGSIHSDYDKAGWRVTRNNVPFMVPPTADLEKLIGSLGIDQDTHVVVVSTGENVTDFGASARIYWTLKYAGVKKLSILDGGIAAWKQAALPVESGVEAPTPKTFTASVDNSILALASDIEKINGSGGAALVDARPVSYFLGKEKAPASQAYGHIPGALNVDSASFFDTKTSRLKSKAELEKAADTVPAGPTVSYCNTGHWAATDWFVLHEVLGRKEARLYAGSMVEWTSNASRPVASSRTKWDDIKKSLGMGL